MEALQGVATGLEKMSLLQVALLILIFVIGNVSWRIVMTMYSRRTGKPVNYHFDFNFFTYKFNWREWLVWIAGGALMLAVGT